MADKIITIRISEAEVSRVIDTMKNFYEIPQVAEINEFTDDEWLDEAIKRWIIHQVYRYEQETAIKSIDVTKITLN